MTRVGIDKKMSRSQIRFLILIYVSVVLIRLGLLYAFSAGPWIMPDETLYLNLARSLWEKGEVLLRGQPVKYDSLLYPLVLSPLYSLSTHIDIYRAVQVVNTLLMNAAIFPLWFLAKRLSGSEKKAWIVIGLCLLLPDMILSSNAMSESLVYPLLMLCLLLLHRLIARDAGLYEAALAGLFCALAYFTKPGLAALGAAASILLWALWLKSRDGIRLKQALLFSLVFSGLCFFLPLAGRIMFGVDGEMLSIYEKQTRSLSAGQMALTAQGTLLYLYFVPVAFGVIPVLIPLSHNRALRKDTKYFLYLLTMMALLLMLGTSYVIYVDELTADALASRIHIRYFAPLLPVFMSLLLSDDLLDRRMNRLMFAAFAFLAAASAVIGMKSYLSNASYPIDALLLAPVTINWMELETRRLYTIFLLFALLTAGAYLWMRGFSDRFRHVFVLSLFVWLALSNALGYQLTRHNDSPLLAADARELAEEMKDDHLVFVADDTAFFWKHASFLDARLRRAIPFVELDDLLTHTLPDGRYSSFLPPAYWVEVSKEATGEAEKLVINNNMLNRIALARGTQVNATINANYAVISLLPGHPWIHSAFSGLAREVMIVPGSKLSVFDSTLNQQEYIRVSLHLRATGAPAALRVSSGTHEQWFDVGVSEEWISFEIPGGQAPTVIELETEGQITAISYLLQ